MVDLAGLPDTGFLDLGDQKLEYRFAGPRPGEAPTLVLLHEGLGCVGLWGDFPQRLSDAGGVGVLAYSRAGYGQSSPVALPRPLDYMTIEAQRVLPRVLDAIGFRHGLLVGHSDGASIAAIHAGSVHDPRIAGVVLIAPHFFTEDMGLAEIAQAKAMYEDPASGLRERLARWHTNVDVAFRGWNEAWLDPGFRAWNIARFLNTVRVPVLVVQGTDDQYGTQEQVRVVQRRCRSEVETVMMQGVRHSPHREASDRLLAEVGTFARGVFGTQETRNRG